MSKNWLFILLAAHFLRFTCFGNRDFAALSKINILVSAICAVKVQVGQAALDPILGKLWISCFYWCCFEVLILESWGKVARKNSVCCISGCCSSLSRTTTNYQSLCFKVRLWFFGGHNNTRSRVGVVVVVVLGSTASRNGGHAGQLRFFGLCCCAGLLCCFCLFFRFCWSAFGAVVLAAVSNGCGQGCRCSCCRCVAWFLRCSRVCRSFAGCFGCYCYVCLWCIFLLQTTKTYLFSCCLLADFLVASPVSNSATGQYW